MLKHPADYGTPAEKRLIQEKFADLDLEAKFLDGIAALEATNKSLIDCVCEWCFKEEIVVEMVALIILRNLLLLSRLQRDGERLHFLKPVRRLAI